MQQKPRLELRGRCQLRPQSCLLLQSLLRLLLHQHHQVVRLNLVTASNLSLTNLGLVDRTATAGQAAPVLEPHTPINMAATAATIVLLLRRPSSSCPAAPP